MKFRMPRVVTISICWLYMGMDHKDMLKELIISPTGTNFGIILGCEPGCVCVCVKNSQGPYLYCLGCEAITRNLIQKGVHGGFKIGPQGTVKFLVAWWCGPWLISLPDVVCRWLLTWKAYCPIAIAGLHVTSLTWYHVLGFAQSIVGGLYIEPWENVSQDWPAMRLFWSIEGFIDSESFFSMVSQWLIE